MARSRRPRRDGDRGADDIIYEYRLFGLALRSAIALPELDPCRHGDPDAIMIRLGVVPAFPHGPGEPPVTMTPQGAVLTVPDVARFCVRDGQTIVVDRCDDASERNMRLFLLGSAMGVLLHQRRILPLHANAVALGAGAVAFLGHSGAGKSTLAASFHDRGTAILSDDVCALVQGDAGFVAQPGIPRLRLWRDAVERSGRSVDGHERAFDALDKYTVRTDTESRGAAMPLAAIYLLVRDDAPRPEILRMTGMTAVRALVENTYRGAFVKIVGDPAAHLRTCLAVTREIPVFTLARPWGAGLIDETIAEVEAHVRSLPALAAF
jgi:hypothetical protein